MAGREEVEARMRADWNERAKNVGSAMSYIIDGYHGDNATFYETGKRHMDDLVYGLYAGKIKWPGGVGVEIGCGIGRMSVWAAQYLDRLYAFDVSSEMIEHAREHAARSNIEYIASPSLLSVLTPNTVDIVFSHIVFQHVPKVVFWTYLDEAWRVLKPGGIFHAQMNMSPEPIDYPETETLLCRGYTVRELSDGLRKMPERWEAISLLRWAGITEQWKWLTLVKLPGGRA